MFYYIRNNTIRGFTKVNSYKEEDKILVDGNDLKIQIAGIAQSKLYRDKCAYWYFDTDGNIYRNLEGKNDLFKPTNGNLVTDLFVIEDMMIMLYSNGAVDVCHMYLNDLSYVLNLVEGGIMKVIYGIKFGSYNAEYLYSIMTITKNFTVKVIEFNVSNDKEIRSKKIRENNLDNCTTERVIDFFSGNYFAISWNDNSYRIVVDIKGDIWTGEKLDSLTLKDMECKVEKIESGAYCDFVVFLMDNGEVYQSKDLRGVEHRGLELIKIPFSTKISNIVIARLGHILDCVVALDEIGNLVIAYMDMRDGKMEWQIKTSETKDKEIIFPCGQNMSRFSTTKRALA